MFGHSFESPPTHQSSDEALSNRLNHSSDVFHCFRSCRVASSAKAKRNPIIAKGATKIRRFSLQSCALFATTNAPAMRMTPRKPAHRTKNHPTNSAGPTLPESNDPETSPAISAFSSQLKLLPARGRENVTDHFEHSVSSTCPTYLSESKTETLRLSESSVATCPGDSGLRMR